MRPSSAGSFVVHLMQMMESVPIAFAGRQKDGEPVGDLHPVGLVTTGGRCEQLPDVAHHLQGWSCLENPGQVGRRSAGL